MARPTGSPGWSTRVLCGVLAACAVANAVAGAVAWHRYQLLLALPPEQAPSGGGTLLGADMWFGIATGWRRAAIVVSVLLFVLWLDRMRGLADQVWPEGQRRGRGWLLFGWVVPVGNLFVPKMFVNDLWAAGRPATPRRRGHPLLTLWWLAVLLAFGSSGAALGRVPRADHAWQACDAMRQVMLTDGLFVAAAALTAAVAWRLGGMLRYAARPAPGRPNAVAPHPRPGSPRRTRQPQSGLSR